MPDEASSAGRPALLVRPLPIVFGLLAGLGTAVLLQQYAVTTLSWGLLIGMALAGAVVIGIGLPTLLMHVMKPDASTEKEVPK